MLALGLNQGNNCDFLLFTCLFLKQLESKVSLSVLTSISEKV